MADDSHGADKNRDALPRYADKSAEADDAVTISVSNTPGEWLVNTNEAVVLPMSMAEVVDALQVGKLSERSLVWRQGMQEWAPIDNVPQLKLAARLPLTRVLGTPTSAATEPAPSTPRKPPPKPARPTPAPQGLSRRSTLPFGIPPQKLPSRPSNPAQLKLTPLPRPASVPPRSSDEPPVLAVYDRPAATISFELEKADSVRMPAPVPAPPETLAPTTSDAQPRRSASEPPAEAELALVAASQLHALRRSAKRLVVVSSLASAAAASLLTFWLSPRSAPAPAASRPAPQATLAAAAVAAPPPPAITPTEPTPSAQPEPAPPASAASTKPPSKKARAVRAAPRPSEPAHAAAAERDPSAEPNPYDVQLEESAPTEPKKAAASRSSGPDSTAKEAEASTATGSSSPGF